MTPTPTQRRERFREILARPQLTSPGSVWDPISARLAAAAGYEFGLMGGSLASATVVGAPDIVVLTLSELAEQVRRTCRYADIPVMVDSDHGYGNALNVRRTVEELEAAGVSALSIEDTTLPQPYGNGKLTLIEPAEFRDKLRAAVDARGDPALVVVGRTIIAANDVAATMTRVRCCIEAKVDAIFLIGRSTKELLTAIHAETSLPLLIGNNPPMTPEEAVALGARITTGGHPAFFMTLQAMYDAFVGLRNGSIDRDNAFSPEIRKLALAEEHYTALAKDFLALDPNQVGRA